MCAGGGRRLADRLKDANCAVDAPTMPGFIHDCWPFGWPLLSAMCGLSFVQLQFIYFAMFSKHAHTTHTKEGKILWRRVGRWAGLCVPSPKVAPATVVRLDFFLGFCILSSKKINHAIGAAPDAPVHGLRPIMYQSAPSFWSVRASPGAKTSTPPGASKSVAPSMSAVAARETFLTTTTLPR